MTTNCEITVDEAIHMHNETPNAELTPAEAYNTETTLVNEIWKETDRFVYLTGGIN